MSYRNFKLNGDIELSTTAEIGRRIYMKALHGRRGFREDQLGMGSYDFIGIWKEIFEAMGAEALEAVSAGKISKGDD